ncbi:MAG TPA: class II aldolase/adducin family protein [Bdellovibrionota bacterium]|nr:class II aldolase/adducin family protein [Bdellovibrionota bacterium]
MNTWKARNDLIHFCSLMYQKDLISSTDGNSSVKVSESRILITPSGIHKGFLKEDDLVVCDMQGKKISGKHKPSSEINTHLSVYRQRRDVLAVVHAHPPTCIAFTVAGLPLETDALPEVILALGKVPIVAYSTPSSQDSGYAIQGVIENYDALILSHHGTVTVGKTLFQAFDRLEKLEHAARVLYLAHQLGGVKKLSKEEVLKLIKHGTNLGFLDKKTAQVTENSYN